MEELRTSSKSRVGFGVKKSLPKGLEGFSVGGNNQEFHCLWEETPCIVLTSKCKTENNKIKTITDRRISSLSMTRIIE